MSRALILLLAVHASSAHAFAPTGAAPSVPPGRLARDIAWVQHGAADRAGFERWTALYDRDTNVPLRIWGRGPQAPRAVDNARVAANVARRLLAKHLAILAPGASIDDFVLVGNARVADTRSVGFAQYHDGVPVQGGAIGFTFKRDRLVMIGSTALPDVAVPAARIAIAPRIAIDWLAADGIAAHARHHRPPRRVVVPRIATTGAIAYALADAIELEADDASRPGRWTVYVDTATGEAFARDSELHFASGTVRFDVPDRAPVRGRVAQPAAATLSVVNGASVMSDADGRVSWNGSGGATVAPGLSGTYVAVSNRAGALASASLALANGGDAVWSAATDEAADAQLAAFIYANQAKQFARAHFDPQLPFLDQVLSVVVNEAPGFCNAYSTGDDLHFYPQTPGTCENTARLADVVYHELAHSLHRHAVIPGVGQFDASLSEGAADTFAAALTGDPGIARGFFFDDAPLRDLAAAKRLRWPADLTGEVHHDGAIFGQTMWDLRRALELHLGAPAGFARFLAIYYATLQRAVDIPSSFAEALVADDDDGDLANGTPNDCDIRQAFAAHGLFDPRVIAGVAPPVRDGQVITLAAAPIAKGDACEPPRVTAATLRWRIRGGDEHEVAFALVDDAWRAELPMQRDGLTVEYAVSTTLASGATQTFPSTPGDPYYAMYTGATRALWCEDFETGAPGWTHSATVDGADRWEVGAPMGQGGDPRAAYDGANALGLALTGDGRYATNATTIARSPAIDLHGETRVHLQLARWLTVQDGYYDRATITANDVVVWRNFASPRDPGLLPVDLVDTEWRLEDIDVSRQVASGAIALGFGLASGDSGRSAGGWTIDHACLVAVGPSCGNAIVEPDEQCDDGNARDGDGCSATCAIEVPDAGGCSTGGAPSLLVLALLSACRRCGTRRRPSSRRTPSRPR